MEFAPGGARRSGTCWPVRLMPGISPASRPSCTEVHASDRRKTISIVYKISHEATVRRFYDAPEKGGEGAGQAYLHLMGDIWHHGDPGAEASGMPPPEAAYVLERRLMALAGFGANDYVMDFGSGAGGETCNMAEITGGRFVGVSNSESLTALARAHAAERGLDDRVEFRTIGDLDYQRMTAWPDGSLDGVTWYESVCHLPDKQAFFDSMFRVIKPGGTLAGLDWLQRPFGEFQEPEQIARWITPMCAAIRLPSLGTLEGYSDMMWRAGFTVSHAVDLFEGVKCWGSTPPEDREKWLAYDGGPAGDLFQEGKRALDACRGAGVFTVGYWVARRTGNEQGRTNKTRD